MDTSKQVIALAFQALDYYLELDRAGIKADWFEPESPARWFWQTFTRLYAPPAIELLRDDVLKAMDALSHDRRQECQEYLDECAGTYVSPGQVEPLRDKLLDAYQRRRTLKDLRQAAEKLKDERLAPETTIAELEKHLAEIKIARTPLTLVTAKQIQESRVEVYLEKLAAPGADKDRMPFEQIGMNNVTKGGIKRKQFTIVVAAPKVGKSAFLQRDCYWRAVHQNYTCLYVTLEMARDFWIDRAITQETGIPSWALEQGRFDSWQDTVFEQLNQFGESNLYMIDDPRSNIETIKRGCENVIRQSGDLHVLYVDYAQRLNESLTLSLHDKMDYISRELAAISRVYNCHVFAISRIKNDGELYGGQQLRYECDIELELKNEKAKQELPEGQKSGPATALFKNQRYSGSGTSAELWWNEDWVRFTDSSQILEQSGYRYDYKQYSR